MDATSSTAVIETILGRRSVRAGYEDRPVPRDVLHMIIGCGLAAPSSKGAQPWRFHVVQDRQQLEFIANAASSAPGVEDWVPHDPRTGRPDPRWTSTVSESAEVLREVPCAILLENLGTFSRGKRELAVAPPDSFAAALDGYAFECMGMGTALENMWLAANALGLQAAFLGDTVIAEAAVAKRFGLTGDLMGVLCVGWAASASRRSPAETADQSVVWH